MIHLIIQFPRVSGCDAVPFVVHFTTLVTILVRLSSRSSSHLEPLDIKDEGSAIFRSIGKYLPESFRRNLTFSNSTVRTSNSASFLPVGSSVTTGWVNGAQFLSGASESLRPGWSGDRIPLGARFSAPVQTGPGIHPASYKMGTGSFLGVKRTWLGVDHPLP